MIWFAMTMRITSFLEISGRLFIRCYWKILVKFSTYSDPLEWVLLLKDRTTTESLNQFQAAIDHKIWLANVSHYVRGHICNEGALAEQYNLAPIFYPTQISTRPKPHSCFRPDPNLFPVFDPSQPPSPFLPDPNLAETDQQERKTNQQTHRPKMKIYNPNSGLQTTANKTVKQEKLLRTTDE